MAKLSERPLVATVGFRDSREALKRLISASSRQQAFKKNEDAKKRLVEAYELMLGFYGIRLVSKETGEVKRAENWKERFGNLERLHV